MTEIRTILCPVDFSEFSRHALDHASAIAHWYGARLVVLHVVSNTPLMGLPALEFDDSTRAAVTDELTRFTQGLARDVAVDVRAQDAPDIHEAILAQAASIGVDLLVLGSHGRSGFKRWLLGSVTEKLIRRAACAVMIVPPRAPDVAPDSPVRFGHIVCPVDFSAGSLLALEHALRMAEESDAQLTVLHVIEVPPELREHEFPYDFDVDKIRAAAEAGALRRLRALIPDEARVYCTVQTAVREGAAFREILKVAGERQADLLVMGLQGRGAIDLMVFGSNTARVTRGAACPVLIVRSTARAQAQSDAAADFPSSLVG